MKITIMSDLHFGFAQGTEREHDVYEAASEAMEKALASDLILITGDIFDMRVPSTEILARAMEIFTKPILSKSAVELVEVINKNRDEISPKSLLGTPVIAIYGTHERRVKGLMNPVQALEKAGFLICLHCNGIIFEKKKVLHTDIGVPQGSKGEKVCVQGMSGVPDQYTESVLKEWNPKPIPGCTNILMIHQSVKEFMHERVPHTISLEYLPKGFDLYILGHIHRPEKSSYDNSPVIIPGSLVPTQLTKESTKSKGFWFFETESRELKFIPLQTQRTIYFIEKENIEEIKKELEKLLSGKFAKKPIIRITGRISNETEKDIRNRFGDRAIISFKKEHSAEEETPRKTLEEHKLSVQELGKKLLEQNIKEFKLDPKIFEQVFELLLEGKQDDALDILSKEFKTSPARERTELQTRVQKESQAKTTQLKPRHSEPMTKKEAKGLERFL